MLIRRIQNYAVPGLLIILAACGNSAQQQPMQGPPPAVPVTVANVEQTAAVYHDEYPGIVTALEQVDLRPQVNGYITGVYFKDGDRVRKGQKLYSIDQQQYEANYQQAIANLQVQEANLVKAQKDADRYHQLDKQDAIAKQQVDNADAALEVAKKQVDAAKANIRGVQTGVKYTTIFAPFDGTIGISAVKIGAPVSAGQTVLNTVSTDNPIAVDFTVDQKEIYRFSQLQGKQNPKDSTFTLAFGNDQYDYPGSIYLVDRAVDPQTSTIKVRLVFPNPKNALKAGMSGTVQVLNRSGSNSILIPYKAVTEQLGEYFVYVVNGDKVTQRKIIPGKQIGTNVIVKDSLRAGEQVVVQGVQNLKEGASIKIAEPGQQQAPGGKQ